MKGGRGELDDPWVGKNGITWSAAGWKRKEKEGGQGKEGRRNEET